MNSRSDVPGVSVVMPAYNAARTISDALSSVLAQRDCTFEVLVHNDASTDDTPSKVEAFEDPRIRLLADHLNLGPGPSRDKAIEEAEAPWIALIDADDAFHPNRLRRLLDAADATGADVVFDDLMMCHDTADGLVPWRPLHGPRSFGGKGRATSIRIEDYIRSARLLVKAVIRTDFIRQNGIRHSSRRFGEDAEFLLRLAHAGARFCFVPDPLYLYRIAPGSLTAQAKDPTLMRRCLEECARWPEWPTSVQGALREKITSLERTEKLYSLAAATRHGQGMTVLLILARSPSLILAALRRIPGLLAYRWHRNRHGGHRR